MIKILFSVVLIIVKLPAFGQFFEGEINFTNYYVDKDSLKPLFDPKPEVVSIKGARYKSFMPNAEQGALEWEIDDYSKNVRFSRKSYKNINYMVTDKEPTFSKDGKIQFQKPDSALVAPIMKGRTCVANIGWSDSLVVIDTTFDISGFQCKLAMRYNDGVKKSEYYYTDSIKLNPAFYTCDRTDHLSKIYRKTNGSLIVQLVEYADGYIWIQQAQSVKKIEIPDATFELPKGVKIEDYKAN
jgi:hypothetical protein